MSKNSKKKATIEDAYDEGSRTMSDDDAHRDKVYKVPSIYAQTATCFMIQMKRYTKHKMIWFLLLLVIAIPVAVFLINYKSPGLLSAYTSNENMSVVLIALPLLSMLIACMTCGKMLPQEFNERTVYLSLPLPMSRNAFYYGKFLAGFFISAGISIAAYGAAMLSCRYIIGSEITFSVPILLSMAIMICATFNYCAFAYMKSSRSRRGSTLFPFIILFVLLPLLAYGITYGAAFLKGLNILGSASSYLDYVGVVLGYTPIFSQDLALANLGGGYRVSAGMILTGLSPYGFMNMIGGNLGLGLVLGDNIIISCAVNIILGLLCLHRGSRKIARRDM